MTIPAMAPEVARVFEGYPAAARRKLKALRRLIFETAGALDGVGALQETLKWGEPSYLTPVTRSGTTIRLGWKAARPGEYFLFVHCQTTLVDSFREWFSDAVVLEGNRAVVFRVDESLPETVVARCIEAALTYHRDRRPRRR